MRPEVISAGLSRHNGLICAHGALKKRLAAYAFRGGMRGRNSSSYANMKSITICMQREISFKAKRKWLPRSS